MVQNINISLEKKLNEFIENEVTILQDGFLKSKYLIYSLKYSIEYEILNITDQKNNNYLKINLNQIYKIENSKKEIKLYLDNDTTLMLKY